MSTSEVVTSRSVAWQLLVLAVPTFGQLVAEPLFILVDTAIVGHVSQAALAGLSLGSTMILTAVGLCVFLAYATTSRVAQLFGAGKDREGLAAGVDNLWLSLLIGIVLAVVLFAGAEPICWALGGRGGDLEQACVYGRGVALGVPGMLLVYASNGVFRGLQKISYTLVAAVSGAILNTVLDLVLIFGFGLGIAGSAQATLIAQWYMGIFLVAPIIVRARRGGVDLRPRLGRIARAGGEGLPLFIRTLALRGALVVTVMVAASLGTVALAGYQVVNASWNLAVNVLDSVAIAGQTLVAAQVGARRFDRARALTRLTARVGFVMGILTGVVFVVIGMLFTAAFSPDVEVQVMARAGMVVCGLALPLQGWMWALDGILIGAGDFKYLAFALVCSSLLYVALLGAIVVGLFPHLGSPVACAIALWCAFFFGLMAFRGAFNWHRIKGDAWMHSAR